MITEQELLESITKNWLDSEKQIFRKYSKLAENNKKVHEKSPIKYLDLDEKQQSLWDTVNLLDQLFIESMKEKALLFNCLLSLFTAWHQYYDQPVMKNVSNRFFEQEINGIIKSNHADNVIMKAIDDLRMLVIVSLIDNKDK